MELIRAKLSHQSCHHLEEFLVIQLFRAPGNVETIRNMTQLWTGINDDKTQLLKKDQLNIDKSEIPELMFGTARGRAALAKEQGQIEISSKFFSQVEHFEVSGVEWSLV